MPILYAFSCPSIISVVPVNSLTETKKTANYGDEQSFARTDVYYVLGCIH